jgi:hypothetical protein
MVKCIWCGEEIEGSIRDHIAEKHVGVKQPEPMRSDPPPPAEPSVKPTDSTDKPKTQLTDKKQINTPSLPMEKPKKRYLDAAEIITLLQNTNKQFSLDQVQGCPLSKENE